MPRSTSDLLWTWATARTGTVRSKLGVSSESQGLFGTAVLSARVTLLRALLPGRFRSRSLPELLEELTQTSVAPGTLDNARRTTAPAILADEGIGVLGAAEPDGAERRDDSVLEVEADHVERVVEHLLRRNRWLRTTCLYRSLVRYVLLRELGLDVRFVMGATEAQGKLLGHAWLERAHRPWREELRHDYRRTFSHP